MLQALENSELIAGYRLRDRIGAGGYGEVWRAEAPGGLAKAVKLVFGRFDERRAACELKALSRIKEVRHPFLLSLERIEVIDGHLIIITELADSSLKDRYEECRSAGQPGVPRDEVLGYLRDAADALDYMSEKHGLQHLDVKPENLLIVGGRVKVGDFGLVKDLQDVSVSLVGGLTPTYAPPEVYDGRPSLHSDQYSLAIVYQQLTTGVLPFPGQTPAQLAAQHLNSRPQLLALPPQDRPTIARALAKNPDERFPSCRAMIDGLCQAGTPAPRREGLCSPGPVTSTETPTDAPSAASHSTQRLPRRQPAGPSGAPPPKPPVLKTVALDALSPEPERAAEETAGPQPAGGAGQAVGAILQSIASLSSEPAVVEDLPAIELGGAKPRLRPTLFLGVGGLAARVERRLRRRLYERFGDLAAVPAIQMLLVDTDPKTAVQATQGDHASCLEARETVTLPLRRPQDYREEAEKHLEWLSRRWLYNVPRSLQTEGLRPLGRLALMDHAGEVFQSLRRAIGAMTSPDALAESSKQAGLEAGDDAPQVFVISSICGGTGSGMVIDLAYAVRMVLAEFHCANQRVYGVLTHSTGRNPSAADVAVANTCACLTELEHYHRAGGYAGDPEWRLPPSVAGSPVFDETYLVDVGNCRDDADFERATAALADYLYLDSVTAGGDFFRQCRDLARAASPPRRQDLTLRTFGLFRIGASDGPIATAAESYLHKAVLDHWRSTDGPRDATTSHLDLELLVSQLRESIRRRLGGDAKACFQEVLSRCAAHGARGSAAPRDVPGSQLMEATDAFLGLPPPDGNPRKSRTDCLPEWLAAELKGRSAEQGAALSSGILEAANIPQSRIGGAQRLARSIADRLRSLEGTVRNDLQAASASLESLQCDLLSAGDQDPEIAERRQRAAPAHRAVPGTDPRWLRYFELRIDETVLRGTLFWLRSVRCQVDAAADQLNAVIAELNILAEASDTPEPGKRLDLGSEVALAPPYDLRASVARTLSARLGELTAQVDRQCWGALLGRQGGLEGLLRDKSGLRTALREEIHRAARSALHEAFKRIDVAAMLLQADGDAGQPPRALRDLVETAAPRWLSAGGSRRFALIGPQSPAIPLLKAAFREGLGLSLSIVCDDRDGWAICCEAEGLSLARVAASLLAQRPQCADIASRLHTRRDVTWLPIASMCQVAADDLLADSQLLGNLRDGRTGVPAGEGAEQDPKPFDEGIRPAQGVSR